MAEGKIKVFHVLTDKNIGGAGRWLLNYLRYHNREVFDVWVVLPEDSALYPAVAALDVAAIPLKDMQDRSYDKKAQRALCGLLREEKPDIVHTHASLTARLAAKQAGVACIYNTKHCMETPAAALPRKLANRLINRRYSNRIIAVSKAVKRSMVAGGTSPKQIVTIYNGIEPLTRASRQERAAQLRAYGGDPEKKAVGIIARLEEVKDHKTFLLAAQAVLRENTQVQFYVIGDGSLRSALEEYAVALGIAPHVIFTGFVAKVEALTAALDLHVITSRQEALCLSIIEGMSAGVPAVGTDSGGVSEVIRHGENGLLAPVGDWEALAAEIAELLSDEEKYLRMGKNAAAWIRAHFTAEKMTARLEQLYLEEIK